MILGTAGHIDHGKTALVLALTGVDTDRLPEEKRRGITIALGFAPLRLDGIGTVGVVDVPGHEAFVRTMLAGATGVDVALLVIAADEGVMPQTREHLAILGLLGVKGGIVALTKRDLVDETMLALVEEDVRAVLAGTPLAAAPIVAVSAKSGEGMEELRAAIVAAAAVLPGAADRGSLPSARRSRVLRRRSGTVVTGTAWSGVVDRDRALRLLPLDRTVRVRSIETHGANVPHATAGGRVALALAGVDRDEVSHDAVLVGVDDGWAPGQVLRADVELLRDAPTLGPRRWVRFHLGTAEVGARVVATGGVAAGSLRAVRLILDAPVTARAGDRFVLRGGSPVTTIGGGTITDPQPPGRRAKPWPAPGASEQDRMEWMLTEAGANGLDLASLPVRLGVRPATVERIVKEQPKVIRLGERLVRTSVLDGLRERLLAVVDASHAAAPLAPGLDKQTARSALTSNAPLADEVIRRAERAGLVVVEGAAIRRPGFSAGSESGATDARARLLEALRAAGPEPPSVAELIARFGPEVPALLKLLEKDRLAYPVALDRWFAYEGLVTLLGRLRAHVRPGRTYSPSELRDPLGITRKWLIPFLEWCDRRRISLRTGDGRTFGAVPEEP